MSRRTAGAIFCAIAAFLFAVRYFAALMLYMQAGTYSDDAFAQWLSYTSALPWVLAAIALGVGIGYLAWAERSDRRS